MYAGLPQAALLDRDGTLIVDRHYTHDPDAVELLPGAARAVARLAALGVPSVVCTSQSGIARGIISLAQYHAVTRRMRELLAAEGGDVRDVFTCPHHPDITGPCACRKPGQLLYEQPARLFGWDLSQCVFMGDKYRDVAPALPHGARAFLILSGETTPEDRASAERDGIAIVASVAEAVDRLVEAGA